MNQVLARPFPSKSISWLSKVVRGDKCLALIYADVRAYYDRLDEIFPNRWNDQVSFQVVGSKLLCVVSLTGRDVQGNDWLRHDGVGEDWLTGKPKEDENVATSAFAQAFKRACVKFGIGRYLYDFPKVWVPYDGKRIPDAEIEKLNSRYEAWVKRMESASAPKKTVEPGHQPSAPTKAIAAAVQGSTDHGAMVLHFGEHKGETLQEIYEADPTYVQTLIGTASTDEIREAAAAVWESNHWAFNNEQRLFDWAKKDFGKSPQDLLELLAANDPETKVDKVTDTSLTKARVQALANETWKKH